MRTIYTKEQLKECASRGEERFFIDGEIKAYLIKQDTWKSRLKKFGIAGLVFSGICLAAIPFTGGASALPVMGLTVSTGAGGALAMSMGELIVVGVFSLASLGIITHGYGTVEVFKREDGTYEGHLKR